MILQVLFRLFRLRKWRPILVLASYLALLGGATVHGNPPESSTALASRPGTGSPWGEPPSTATSPATVTWLPPTDEVYVASWSNTYPDPRRPVSDRLPPMTTPFNPSTQPSACDPDVCEVAPRQLRVASRFGAAWLAGGGGKGFGNTDVDVNTTFAPNWLGLESPILMTPGFGVHLWNAPAGIDLPSSVYDISVDLNWRPEVSEHVAFNLGITPGVYSDFNQITSNAFQLTGWGLMEYTVNDNFEIVGGIIYIRQLQSHVLAMGGVIWAPNDETRLELLFPRPRVARRLRHDCQRELWGYVAGEFGGGSWEIAQPATNTSTRVVYSDLRVLLGLQWLGGERVNGVFEVGYVFSRNIYLNGFDYTPDSTVVLQGYLSF